jgi:hypothetical protein
MSFNSFEFSNGSAMSESDNPCYFRSLLSLVFWKKCFNYWLLKTPPMVVGLDPDAPHLDVQVLRYLFRGDLPSIVFSDDALTKMHDSLPVSFRVSRQTFQSERAGLGRMVPSLGPRQRSSVPQKNVEPVDRMH